MKVFDKKVGETTYYKYRINLPKKMVEEGDFLDIPINIILENEKIVITKEK